MCSCKHSAAPILNFQCTVQHEADQRVGGRGGGLVMRRVTATPIVQITSFSLCHFPSATPPPFVHCQQSIGSCFLCTAGHPSHRMHGFKVKGSGDSGRFPLRKPRPRQLNTGAAGGPQLYALQHQSAVSKETRTTSLIITKQVAAEACDMVLVSGSRLVPLIQ